QLPPGLKLKAHSGAISGVPATAGEYRFTVAGADSSAPPLQAQRAMTITVIAGLTIDWKQYPKVQGATLSGSVVVTNQTGQDFDLTVVVVAVNSIGRATTLGYQHFTLAADKSGPVIPFSSSPGLGTYVVRAVANNPTLKWRKGCLTRADEEMAYPNIAKCCTWSSRTVTNWVTFRDLPRVALAGELL